MNYFILCVIFISSTVTRYNWISTNLCSNTLALLINTDDNISFNEGRGFYIFIKILHTNVGFKNYKLQWKLSMIVIVLNNWRRRQCRTLSRFCGRLMDLTRFLKLFRRHIQIICALDQIWAYSRKWECLSPWMWHWLRRGPDLDAILACVCTRWRTRRARRNRWRSWGRRDSWPAGRLSNWGMLVSTTAHDAFRLPLQKSKHVTERYYFCSACTGTLIPESTDHHSGKHWSRLV